MIRSRCGRGELAAQTVLITGQNTGLMRIGRSHQTRQPVPLRVDTPGAAIESAPCPTQRDHRDDDGHDDGPKVEHKDADNERDRKQWH